MVDFIIILFLLGFLFLGFREGLVKTLGSIALIFLALFLASAALNYLSRVSPEFSDPKTLLALIAFIIVWVAVYVALDLLLKLILNVVINVNILGPLDRVGGLLLGGVRGLLLAGIILQLIFSFPISDQSKKSILDSLSAKFSIATFQLIYPAAKQWAPYFKKFTDIDMKMDFIEGIGTQEAGSGKLEKLIEKNLPNLKKQTDDQEKRLKELLEDENLGPSTPSGRPK